MLDVRARLTWGMGVPDPRVIVHIETGWRSARLRDIAAMRVRSASSGRFGVRSARSSRMCCSLRERNPRGCNGPCVVEGTRAKNALDNNARTPSRRALGRSQESRSAARAGKDTDNTAELLKLCSSFRKTDNNLARGDPQSVSSLRRCRAITIRWISDVPSPISQTLASRIMRSTG